MRTLTQFIPTSEPFASISREIAAGSKKNSTPVELAAICVVKGFG